MPVAAPAAPAAAPAAAAVTDAATSAPAAGFADALGTARRGDAATAFGGAATGALPSIGLASMVALRAGADAQASAAVASAPAEVGAPPAAGTAGSGAAGASANEILRAGERYLGVPYKWGGTDPATGLDCSGFVQRVFADLGVSLPRVSVDQAKAGTAVSSLAEAKPGDLVFWRGNGSRPNHIGIYAGDDQMLVAPRTGDVVRYQTISRTPDGIRRIVD